MTKSIAIIGGGPKAAAIAAKAYCLEQEGYQPPKVTIYSEHGIGSMWTGQHGYTDGLQALCTPAERDLGFPYDRSAPNPAVSERMLAEFSWHKFLISGRGNRSYDKWVVAGRRPSEHREFAEYLKDAVARAGVTVQIEPIAQIDHDGVHWIVTPADQNGTPQRYDGIVITGIGTPFRPLPGGNPRVFDARDFWKWKSRVIRLLSGADPGEASVAVIGGGGTAAAVVQWFLKNQATQDLPINIVGHEATLFTRTANMFEDRLFSDDFAWQKLALHTRARFLERLTRAAIWEPVIRALESAQSLTYHSATVKQFTDAGPSSYGPNELVAELTEPPDDSAATSRVPVHPPRPPDLLPATVFIDSRGFNRWWFTELFPRASRIYRHFAAAQRESIMRQMDVSLAVAGPLASGDPFPAGLHIPNVATYQGPAATNLMALGWLADRILRPYLGSLRPSLPSRP